MVIFSSINWQRYWGCPIPVIYENGEPNVIDKNDMPVKLPKLEKDSPPIPLSQNKDFMTISDSLKRESDTFDTFMDSSWYYARFTSADVNLLLMARDGDQEHKLKPKKLIN